MTIFQAVRELLFNVTKHAGVAEAAVEASLVEGDRLRVVVSDNGAGFDSSRSQNSGDSGTGFGLFGVQERVESVGGTLEVDTAPGRGTRVALEFPVTTSDESLEANGPAGSISPAG